MERDGYGYDERAAAELARDAVPRRTAGPSAAVFPESEPAPEAPGAPSGARDRRAGRSGTAPGTEDRNNRPDRIPEEAERPRFRLFNSSLIPIRTISINHKLKSHENNSVQIRGGGNSPARTAVSLV